MCSVVFASATAEQEPGFDSRVGQSAIGVFHREFLSNSYGAWMCARLIVIKGDPIAWDLKT